MRLIVLAIVFGAALGAAMLLPLPPGVPTSRTNADDPVNAESSAAVALGRLAITASHSDSNTSGEIVRLNQNVINGISTTICTRDATLRQLVHDAVRTWNNALRDLGFSVFTIVSTSSCAGAKIEVVQSPRASCRAGFNEAMGTGTRACYRAHPTDNPPRKEFSNTKMPPDLQDRALVIYQALSYEPGSRVHFATMMHELGHALGLSHYEHVCALLRTASVDPVGDHFVAMASAGDACRARGVVTGRDLRDFYEAYHVGPVTNVGHAGSATVSVTGMRTRLDWGADGARQAWHGASRLVVMAKTASGWRVVQSTPISVKDTTEDSSDDEGTYRPVTSVTFTDSSSVASLYKLVGVTRGDLQLHTLDEPVTLTVSGSTKAYDQGDPTYIVGLTPIGQNPMVFSASLGRRYCFQGTLIGALSVRASGGNGSPTIYRPSRVCPASAGRTTFQPSATWPSSTGPVSRPIDLSAQVYQTPQAIGFIETLAASPSSCVSGEIVKAEWQFPSAPPSQQPTVWIDGNEASSSPAYFICPDEAVGENIHVQVLALRSGGGGVALSVEVIEPLTVRFARSGNAPPRNCPAGGRGSTTVYINGGTPPYKLTLGGETRTSPVNRSGVVGAFSYPCPAAEGFGTLNVSVTDNASRIRSDSVALIVDPATPTANAPDKPTTLSIRNVTQRGATLTWSALPGATGYDVQSGVNGTPVSVTGTSHRFAALPSGTHTLFVRAKNAQGIASKWAGTTIALPPPSLAMPSGTAIGNISSNQATLTWSAVSGAARYEYSWSGLSASRTTTATSRVLTGLQPGRFYAARVRTQGANSLVSDNAWVAFTTPTSASAPTSPGGLRVSNVTQQQITLSWNAVAGATGYEVKRDIGGAVTTVTGTSYRFWAPDAGLFYTLYVRAKNAQGRYSAWSSTTASALPPAIAAPTGMAISVSGTSATLSWNAATGATFYGVWRSGAAVRNTTTTSYTFSGLSRNTHYYMSVRARRANSNVSFWVTQRVWIPMAAPSGLRASPAATSATLTWSAVSGAASYDVMLGASGLVTEVPSGRTYTFTELAEDTSYTLYVRARNSSGVSSWAAVAARTRSAPDAPTGLSVSTTRTGATLSWTAAAGATSYEVKRGASGTVATVSSGRSHTFSGLTASTSYTLYVRAKNSSGTSDWVSIAARTKGIPDVPTDLTVNTTRTGATLSWTATDGATSYEVKRGASGTVATVSSGRTHTFSGLTANTLYTLYVRAKNSNGTSAWTSIAARTTPLPPPQPTGLDTTPTANSLTFSWSAAARATSYEVKRGASGTVATVSSGRTYTFYGLTPNTSYTLFVRAKNAGGESNWSSYTGTTGPRVPTNLRVSATSTTLTLSWTGDVLARFDVKRGRTGTLSDTGGSSYTFTGLSASTSYTLYVRAKTDAGKSTWVSLTRRTTPVPAPTGVETTDVLATSATLEWTAVGEATGYQVRKNSGTAISVSSTSYTFSGLTRETSYTLEVRARNSGGVSRWVSESTRTATFEGRIRARLRSTGRVEFCFLPTGGACIEPTARYVQPSGMVSGRWYHSSSIDGSVGGRTRTLGKISVRKPAGQTYIEVCFTPAGGSRVCPTKHKFAVATATVDVWRYTSQTGFVLPAGASGSAEEDDPADGAMSPAGADEPATPGTDGGLMDGDP